MTNSSIELKYTLNPPSGIPQPISATTSTPVPASDKLSFPLAITPSTSATTAEYYRIASESLRTVQNTLNELLTPWKDSIGDLEKNKEDMGKVAHGHGRAAMMSAEVNGEMRTSVPAQSQSGGVGEESSDEEESD